MGIRSLTNCVSADNAVSGRAILATKPGGPEVLELSSDYKARMPNKGEILVKMASTGINNLECCAL